MPAELGTAAAAAAAHVTQGASNGVYLRVGDPRFAVACDVVDVGAACRQGGVHVGDLALHELEFPNSLAKLLALVHVPVHARQQKA